MAEQTTAFLSTSRKTAGRRPVDIRIQDWREVYVQFESAELERQASRCMNCGIPFCHNGCPLGNLIPEWNDLVQRQHWREAIERLHATNNFPEFTGRLCPAPCESACVLGINADPVAIKQVEVEIIDRAFAEGWVVPAPPGPAALAGGRRVAVVGSGPAGLAAAQQLTRAGHAVTVFEADDQPGGLLRYGIPEFKCEKRLLDRRLDQLRAEGTVFVCGVRVGEDLSVGQLRADFDAVVLACGARVGRGLPVPGAELDGIHQAMEYLPLANRAVAGAGPDGSGEPPISARGRRVVIIGGGDTGADCLGTAHRQGAESVTQLEILPRPPEQRPASQPWPTYPMIFRTSSAHEEGGERVYAVSTQEFLADESGRVRALRLVEVELTGGRPVRLPGTERELACELVLLAMGFTGAEDRGLVSGLGVGLDERGRVPRDDQYATSVPGVYVAGDMGRGQSLIVWAIAEGRSAAAAVDRYLVGQTALPVAIPASAAPLRA
ncbi:MAG TPA: glutamate synthase subunit beta [Streptosporangiaceae bacterium]|jgi:glutamate synthase (NADPH) small chain|nr:glutamate synthase subunit beta [Streptosporangiaceae bacterium]